MTREELESGISRLRLTKYEIVLFNNNFSKAVYVFKMSAIMFGIVGGFGFLKLVHQNPVLAVIFGNPLWASFKEMDGAGGNQMDKSFNEDFKIHKCCIRNKFTDHQSPLKLGI